MNTNQTTEKTCRICGGSQTECIHSDNKDKENASVKGKHFWLLLLAPTAVVCGCIFTRFSAEIFVNWWGYGMMVAGCIYMLVFYRRWSKSLSNIAFDCLQFISCLIILGVTIANDVHLGTTGSTLVMASAIVCLLIPFSVLFLGIMIQITGITGDL